MTAGAWSTWQIEQWLDGIVAATSHLALMDDDPFGVTDPLTVELSGGGYNRVAITWGRPSAKQLRVNNLATFSGLTPGSTVRAIAGFDAATNGNMRFAVFPDTPATITASGLYVVPANSVYVGLDV